MLHIENIDANTFKMYGDIAAVPADIYPKNYEAKAVVVYGEAQPRITISHRNRNEKIAILKRFDEIEIASATFASAQLAVQAFNVIVGIAGGSIVVDGYNLYLDDTTGLYFRTGIRDSGYKIDKELTTTGFAGDEDTDWENIGGAV